MIRRGVPHFGANANFRAGQKRKNMRGVFFAIALLVACAWAAFPVAGMQNLDPLVVDPQHYQLEFENQYVKIIRCKIPPHDKVKMHHHPVGSVVVLITDQNLKQTEADGKVGEAHRKAGLAFWADPVTHMGENISDKPYEYVRVDIKAATH
jgi:hypothetical protein